MLRFIVVVFALLVSTRMVADALTIEAAHSVTIDSTARLSPHAVQFSKTSLCFRTVAASAERTDTIVSTHCSFDGGATFEVVKDANDMCVRGIMIASQLLCPGEQVQQPEEGEAEYSVVSHEIRGAAIHGESSKKRFVFKGNKHTGLLNQVSFNGNAAHIEEEDAYIFVSTVVNEAGDKKVVAFRSEDGFTYTAVSVLPGLEEAEQHYTVSEGGRKLSVLSSFSGSYYTSVSSGYGGKFWSAMKVLNTTAPPASVTYPSGAQLQYACSNETSQGARWYVADDKSVRAIAEESAALPSVSGTSRQPLLLAFPVDGVTSDKKGLLVLQDESTGDGQARVRASAFVVDDSAEEQEKAAKIAKEREAWQKKEAARLKAKLEMFEREKAQRRERRRKEAERKARFVALDQPNVLAAKVFLEKDGEMVVVRRVHKDSISLEKELFFGDL
ncbi:hypothetical protein NESM_000818300 [Novymonas esmeraldas]|uniref:Uncharacterized protein n=1 Tax=Novymonas esmeraldas TaxID=1808958 RepID=A0AAW0EYI0_9TRYP